MTRCTVILVAALLCSTPSLLCAQEATHDWSRLNADGRPTVHVLPEGGPEVTGKLLRVDPESIVVMVNGLERRFEQRHIRRIDKRGDSLRNGALAGSAVGAAVGLLAALIADCPQPEPGGSCHGVRAAGFALSVGAYAAVGAGIDALIVGRSTLYEPPTVSSPSPPPPSRESVGLRLGFRW